MVLVMSKWHLARQPEPSEWVPCTRKALFNLLIPSIKNIKKKRTLILSLLCRFRSLSLECLVNVNTSLISISVEPLAEMPSGVRRQTRTESDGEPAVGDPLFLNPN